MFNMWLFQTFQFSYKIIVNNLQLQLKFTIQFHFILCQYSSIDLLSNRRIIFIIEKNIKFNSYVIFIHNTTLFQAVLFGTTVEHNEVLLYNINEISDSFRETIFRSFNASLKFNKENPLILLHREVQMRFKRIQKHDSR